MHEVEHRVIMLIEGKLSCQTTATVLSIRYKPVCMTQAPCILPVSGHFVSHNSDRNMLKPWISLRPQRHAVCWLLRQHWPRSWNQSRVQSELNSHDRGQSRGRRPVANVKPSVSRLRNKLSTQTWPRTQGLLRHLRIYGKICWLSSLDWYKCQPEMHLCLPFSPLTNKIWCFFLIQIVS